MKIVSQSSDEMVLHEGNIQGIVIGVACIVAGVLAAYFLHATKPIAVWIGLGAVALGVGVICFASSITVNASKSKGQLLYEKKRLIGAKSSTYAIADILRIETRKQWRVDNTRPVQLSAKDLWRVDADGTAGASGQRGDLSVPSRPPRACADGSPGPGTGPSSPPACGGGAALARGIPRPPAWWAGPGAMTLTTPFQPASIRRSCTMSWAPCTTRGS